MTRHVQDLWPRDELPKLIEAAETEKRKGVSRELDTMQQIIQ
jgi:hypothetical protein